MITILNGNQVAPSSLSLRITGKRVFDPAETQDLAEFNHFVTKGGWKNGSCPFILQWPYLDIPSMCNALTAKYYMQKVAKVK